MTAHDPNETFAPSAEFAAPSGYAVDPERAELHTRALEYQSAHPGVAYVDAVRILERSH